MAQRQELGDPAARAVVGDLARRRVERRRAQQREPQPAVGGEALLRREVVDVGLRDVDAAGRRRPRSRRSARARRRRRPGGATGTITPVEVSLWAQAITSAAGSPAGSGASPGSAPTIDRIARGTARAACRPRTSTRTRRSVRCSARSRDQAAGRGVPERGRAAVAEHHLVAVGQPNSSRSPRGPAPTSCLHGLLAVRGAHQRGARPRELRELLGADPRRARAEAAVGRLQLSRNLRGRWTCLPCGY